jgi:diguanylate cyclase (GGDEF)-like protein
VIKLRGLSARIVFAVVLLVAVLQAAVFALVSRANDESARDRAAEELVLGEQTLTQALATERRQLQAIAALLAADPALRETLAGDASRTQERLAARLALTPAQVAQVVDAGGVRAHVTVTGGGERDAEPRLAGDALLAQALQGGSATAVVEDGGRVFDVVAVPVPGSAPQAYLLLALAYDTVLAKHLQQLTTLATSFVRVGGGTPAQLLGSSLPDAQAQALPDLIAGAGAGDVQRTHDGQHAYRAVTLARAGEARVQAVLQRAFADVLPVFERMRSLMLMLALASVALALGAGLLMAHALTRPLRKLTEAAQRIRDGDYRVPIEVRSADEIGKLAESLNHMRQSIAERDEQNQKLAYSDTLTGLPNRTRLIRSILHGIEQARQEQGIKPNSWVPEPGHGHAAVMLLDLDRFKQINDTLGHRVGDAVLSLVSKRINQAVRPADTVARLGGDEFAVALPRADESVARDVARQITQALKAPIECEELNRELKLMEENPVEYDSSIDVGASIGIAVYPEDGVDDQTLLRRADIAMYAAKRKGASYALFDPKHEVARLEHLSLVSDLRRAVAGAELRAFYQPKVDVQTGRAIGAEALVRWEHPQRGLLSPAEFIPYAEQTGHITWVTKWMLAVTLRQCGAWAAAGAPLQVAVNLSTRDLLRPDLVGEIRKRLADHAVPPHLVCLEITESAFMQDPERALKLLHELHALGVHLSIDDFGTGFSSLSYMKRLPVHELKIDSTFVQGMATGEKDVAIVRSTIELAHNLGLKVVAEGVEDERCLERLREMGCDIAQGYLLAKPMRRKYYERWLKQQHGIDIGAKAADAEPQIEHIELAG